MPFTGNREGGPVRYTVTSRKPYGREYHGPGHARSRAGLRLYHLTNRPAGVREAKRRGCKRVDLDVMHTLGGVPVNNHSLDAMGKEGFRARGVPHRTIDRLTWPQVKRLRTGPHRIHHIRWVLEECARTGVIAALDLKGRWDSFRIDQLVLIANQTGAWVYIKADPRKPHLRWALNQFRARGLWTRWNGSPVLRAPR